MPQKIYNKNGCYATGWFNLLFLYPYKKYTTRPTANQPKNHAQLFFVIPVSKYIQVVRPSKGISEKRRKKVNTAMIKQNIQKRIREIWGVAASIKLIFFST